MSTSRAPQILVPAKVITLTEQEHEIVGLVVMGLKDEQIASRLSINGPDVSDRLLAIFANLGVSDRLELIIYAYYHGLT